MQHQLISHIFQLYFSYQHTKITNVKKKKSYINSVNEFAKVLKDAGYFNKEV